MIVNLKKAIVHTIHSYPKTDFSKLETELMGYEVISFDIFDTALKRRCGTPSAIFDIVEQRSGIAGYAHKRVAAEQSARRAKGKYTQLSDIYECYETSEDERCRLMTLELEAERENLVANKPILQMYKHLIEADKHVIFISDMYLPASFIGRVLAEEGYEAYDFLLVSGELGLEKSDGKLFAKAIRQFPDYRIPRSASVIHVGDSIRADWLGPKRVGFSSRLIARFTNHNG